MKMNRLIKWWNDHKENSKRKAIEAFKADYKVSERNGKIYLVYQGYAFAVLSDKMTASEIAKELDNARNAALEYGGLCK